MNERFDELIERVRASYHSPPDTPREALWRVIAEQVGPSRPADGASPVIDIAQERERRATRRPLLWATAVAAALVVLGIGIGRSTAPGVATGPTAAATLESSGAPASVRDGLRRAADEHLGRTESLLTMVRADARGGSLSPGTAEWARELLVETRLLMDARTGQSREVRTLLEDLELVLAQIVGVAELGAEDGSRARTELELTMRGLENGEVLPRIQAAMPAGQAGA